MTNTIILLFWNPDEIIFHPKCNVTRKSGFVILKAWFHKTFYTCKYPPGTFFGPIMNSWKNYSNYNFKCLKVLPAEAGEGFMGYKLKENRVDADSETSKYDKMAFKYLGLVCFPLASCYMVYSVYYNEHKSWYSFCLQSAYGFLLTFGFIAMTPQLFINYKVNKLAIIYQIYIT